MVEVQIPKKYSICINNKVIYTMMMQILWFFLHYQNYEYWFEIDKIACIFKWCNIVEYEMPTLISFLTFFICVMVCPSLSVITLLSAVYS